MTEGQSRRDALTQFLRSCGVTAELAERPRDRFGEATVNAADRDGRAAPHGGDGRAAPHGGDERNAPHGGDEGVSGSPVDRAAGRIDPASRVAEPAARDADRASGVSASIPSAGAAPPPSAETDVKASAPVMEAREAAGNAGTLDDLHRILASFEGCPLKATARNTCLGEGPMGAPIMLVGEAPGHEEDQTGRPFVGRSGRLLERMLAAIGFAREEVYITNVIAWRPPGNRTPSPVETATCEVFVRREIALVRPRVLVPLGGAAARTLLAGDQSIGRQRGRWVSYAADPRLPELTIDAVATFHPAYLLRAPAAKRHAWRDLLAIRSRLERVHGLPTA